MHERRDGSIKANVASRAIILQFDTKYEFEFVISKSADGS